jgi:hypothetical protein
MAAPYRLTAPGLHEQSLSGMVTVAALAAPISYEAPFVSWISTVSDPSLFLFLSGSRQPRPHPANIQKNIWPVTSHLAVILMVFAISLQTLDADKVWWLCRCALFPSHVQIVGVDGHSKQHRWHTCG